MTRMEFEEFFNMRLKELKKSRGVDSKEIQSFYEGKCCGLLVLAFELDVIDFNDFERFRDKIFR